MDLSQKVHLIVATFFIAFNLLWHAYLFFLYCKHRETSFMKSRSPHLFLASALASLLGLLLVLAMTLLFTITQNTDHAVAGFLLSDIACAPTMYAAYIFRVAQITNIVSAKGNASAKWFSQYTYLRLLLIFAIAAVVVGITLVCLLLKGKRLTEDYSDVAGIIMAGNFLANYLWLMHGVNIAPKRGPIKELKEEVIVLAITWVLLNALFHAFLMRGKQLAICTWLLVARNMTTSFISFMLPMMRGLHRKFVPYGETRKCVSNIELALATRSSFLVFFDFIKSIEGDRGRNTIMLYAQIKRFEDISAQRENQELAIRLAGRIANDYLLDQSEFRVEGVPEEVRQHIGAKLQNLSAYLDSHLFDPLYGVVLNILERHFEQFRKSSAWQTLLIELRNNEIVYERLIKSDLL